MHSNNTIIDILYAECMHICAHKIQLELVVARTSFCEDRFSLSLFFSMFAILLPIILSGGTLVFLIQIISPH